jgi:hypothetical protein
MFRHPRLRCRVGLIVAAAWPLCPCSIGESTRSDKGIASPSGDLEEVP